MIKLSNREAARKLFEPIRGAVLRSAFEAGFGEIWVNDADNPSSAAVIVGDYCFFGGEPDVFTVSCLPADREMTIVTSDDWFHTLREVFYENAEASVRYRTKKISWFNLKKLLRIVRRLDEKYSVFVLEKSEFESLKKGDWSKPLLSAYEDFRDFKEKSFGFVIKSEDMILSAAAGYAVCGDGAEIFAVTRPPFRGQGLATAASAMFISECCRKNIYPYFTAENKISLEMAKTLGYVFRTGEVCYRTKPISDE